MAYKVLKLREKKETDDIEEKVAQHLKRQLTKK